MRARVIRTIAPRQREWPWPATCGRTLGHVNVTAREAIQGGEAGVHADAVLCPVLATSLGGLSWRHVRTESRTWPSALSSLSTLSFSAMSSRSVSCAFGMPFEPDDVGPAETVGACRSSMCALPPPSGQPRQSVKAGSMLLGRTIE